MEKDSVIASERPDYDDEIDVRELLTVLWAGKISIIGIVFVFGLVSVLAALSLPNKYTSEALLAPRSDGGANGALGQMASQFGGLATLAGVNFGALGNGVGETAVAIETLKSREFFGIYLYDEVLVDLMAAEGWDRGTDKVLIDESLFDANTATWVRDVGEAFQVKPSVQEAHKSFKRLLSVTEDKKTGFVTVAVTHYSPTVARNWVSRIVKGVNEAVRARDVLEAEKSIAFLNDQSLKTNLVSVTEVFAELIEQQTKTVMLANSSDEYVFQVIEPPVAPESKSEPRRALICVLGTLLGGVLAILFVVMRHYSRKQA